MHPANERGRQPRSHRPARRSKVPRSRNRVRARWPAASLDLTSPPPGRPADDGTAVGGLVSRSCALRLRCCCCCCCCRRWPKSAPPPGHLPRAACCSTRLPCHVRCSVQQLHLACFGALHEPRRRHVHPCAERANGRPPCLTSTYISSDLSQSAQYTFTVRWRRRRHPGLHSVASHGIREEGPWRVGGGLQRSAHSTHSILPCLDPCDATSLLLSMTHAVAAREPCHAALDLLLGRLLTAYKHTHADMSLCEGSKACQTHIESH